MSRIGKQPITVPAGVEVKIGTDVVEVKGPKGTLHTPVCSLLNYDLTDGVLTLYINVIRGLRVYPAVIKKHLDAEMPFMVTENIMMYCVTHKGGDRQELHEHIRQHSVAAGINIKQNGAENDLYDRILADPIFGLSKEELEFIVSEGRITGLAQKQTEDFLADYVQPVLAKYGAELGAEATVNV